MPIITPLVVLTFHVAQHTATQKSCSMQHFTISHPFFSNHFPLILQCIIQHLPNLHTFLPHSASLIFSGHKINVISNFLLPYFQFCYILHHSNSFCLPLLVASATCHMNSFCLPLLVASATCHMLHLANFNTPFLQQAYATSTLCHILSHLPYCPSLVATSLPLVAAATCHTPAFPHLFLFLWRPLHATLSPVTSLKMLTLDVWRVAAATRGRCWRQGCAGGVCGVWRPPQGEELVYEGCVARGMWHEEYRKVEFI